MDRVSVIRQLTSLQTIMVKGRLSRLSIRPLHYVLAQSVKVLFKLGILQYRSASTRTLFGFAIKMPLPSHQDIYMFGCKASPSDVCLCLYLARRLKESSTLIDIGASIGFYSLYFSQLTDKHSSIHAIEPSGDAFQWLRRNTEDHPKIKTHSFAVGDADGQALLHQFPTLYAEYNTIHLDSYLRSSEWFEDNKILRTPVPMKSIDSFVKEHHLQPTLVKIDAENSEWKILSGMTQTIEAMHPDFILRYWPEYRNNEIQLNTINRLLEMNYRMYLLQQNGDLKVCSDLHHLHTYKLEYIILKVNH